MHNRKFVLVADNVRSLENIGTLFRVADAFGAQAIYIVGISGYPDLGPADTRRPWLREKNTRAIKKTALTGFDTVPFKYFATISDCIAALKADGYSLVSIEQDARSEKVESLKTIPFPCAFIFGNEVTGVSTEFIDASERVFEITQHGAGKSLNVAVSAGIVCFIATNLVY